ncbi:hypothetical protein ACXN5S_04450 [Pseudoroseicyclus sp. H15]
MADRYDPNDPTRPVSHDESTRVVVEPARSRGGSAGLIAAAIVAIVVIIALLAWLLPDRGPIEEGLATDPAADVTVNVDNGAGPADGAEIEPADDAATGDTAADAPASE